jgi:CRP/FNR family transcriptional regulator, dissimilatory nitrate respiration regulator
MDRNVTAAEWKALAAAQSLLAHVPLKLRRVARHCEVTAGTALFRLGGKPSSMFYVMAGEVRMIRRSRRGAEIVLQRACRGFLAEASLGSAAYHCDGVAAEDSSVLRFPGAAFRIALDEDGSFRSAWARHLAAEVRRLRAQCERLSLRAATDRVVHYIECEGSDGTLVLNRSRKNWAAELGLTHEALYRALARLVAAGMLTAEGRRLALKRPPSVR